MQKKSLALYLLICLIFLPKFFYCIDADSISYIDIARSYLQGHWYYAINGYWGPLLSWLLIPLLAVKIHPLIAMRIVFIFSGGFLLFSANRLLFLSPHNKYIKRTVPYLLSLIIAKLALFATTPDIILAGAIVFYLTVIFKDDYLYKSKKAVICGFWGAVCYFAKGYGLPFFIVHFTIVNILFILKEKTTEKQNRIKKNYILGMATFTVIVSLWIGAVSSKYGKLVVNSAGSYNWALINHSYYPRRSYYLNHPMHRVGFLPPPHPDAISVWDDPTYLIPPSYRKSNLAKILFYEGANVFSNLRKILFFTSGYSFLSICLLIILVGYLLEDWHRLLENNIFYIFLTMLIFSVGYSLIIVEPRYALLNYILLVILGAELIDAFFVQNKYRHNIVLRYALIVFISSFLILPFRLLNTYNDFFYKDIMTKAQYLRSLHIAGRIASNAQWHYMLYLSFYNHWQYWGEEGDLEEDKVEEKLKKDGINYYFVWIDKKGKINCDWCYKYTDVTKGRLKSLRIYKIQ